MNKNTKITKVVWTLNHPFNVWEGELSEENKGTFEDLVMKLLQGIANRSKYHAYTVCQLEIGAQGTPHLQGFSLFSSQILLGEITTLEKNGTGFLGAFSENTNHPFVDRARGSNEQCIAYCTKEETRKWGPWSIGDIEKTKNKKRDRGGSIYDDIEWCADKIDSGEWTTWDEVPTATKISRIGPNIKTLMAEVERRGKVMLQRNVKVFVIVGEAGWGKSTMVWQMAREQGWTIMTKQVGSGNSQWYSDVEGTYDLLFLDEFDAGQMKMTEFNQILDGFPLLLPSKGKQGYATFTKVVIASNYDPKSWFQKTVTTKEMDESGRLVTVVDSERQKDWETRRKTVLRRIGIHEPDVAQYSTNGKTLFLPTYEEIQSQGWIKGGKADLAQARYEVRRMMTQWLGGDVARCDAGPEAQEIPAGSPDEMPPLEDADAGDTQPMPVPDPAQLTPGSPFIFNDSEELRKMMADAFP